MSSTQQVQSMAPAATSAPAIATSDAPAKPKEKAKRDECMLFSKSANPAEDCKSTVEEYRVCMAGFGFKV